MDQHNNDQNRAWRIEVQELLVRILVAVGTVYIGTPFFASGCGCELLMHSGYDPDLRHLFFGRLELLKSETNFEKSVKILGTWRRITLPKFFFRFRQFIMEGEYVDLARGKDKEKAEILNECAAMATNDPAESAFGVMAANHLTQQSLGATCAKSIAIRNKTFSDGIINGFYNPAKKFINETELKTLTQKKNKHKKKENYNRNKYNLENRAVNKTKQVNRYAYRMKVMKKDIFLDHLIFGNEVRKIERKKRHATKLLTFLRDHCSTIKKLYFSKQNKKDFPIIKNGVQKVQQSKNGVQLLPGELKANLKEFLKTDLLNWAKENLNNMKIEKKEAVDGHPNSFKCTLSTTYQHTFRLMLTQKQIHRADLE